MMKHLVTLFLCLAAKYLGDDAFHLAPVSFVNQLGTPGSESVASYDEPSEPAKPPPHEFTRRDLLAVSVAELCPRDHAGHHQSHRARRIRTQSHSA